jgi:hypothetical protein
MMRSMHWVRRLAQATATCTVSSISKQVAAGLCSGAVALAMTQGVASAQTQLAEATIVPGATGVPQPGPPQQVGVQAAPQQGAGQHPLIPALEMAYKTKVYMDANLKDYSATVVKQERIDGVLGENEYAFVKVRNQPFSVYMYFLAPDKLKGQECMYISGQNQDKMFAHAKPGTLRGAVGTVQISPTSAMAMQGQRYPITELGIYNLTKRLIEVGEHDKQYGECDVKFFDGTKVNGRECTVIQVTHPVPRKSFLFHKALIYLDKEMGIPIRYESYDWPAQAGGPPELLEAYTYMNVKINQGFTDADFDARNPAYKFNMK